MPRANRHFLPGHVWHLTHRGHERDFLLKFARDRNNYMRWLYEARKQRRQGQALPFACFVRTDEPLNPVMSRGRQKARPDPITHYTHDPITHITHITHVDRTATPPRSSAEAVVHSPAVEPLHGIVEPFRRAVLPQVVTHQTLQALRVVEATYLARRKHHPRGAHHA